MRKLLVFDSCGRGNQSVSAGAFDGAEGAACGTRRDPAVMFTPPGSMS